jgi:hypothetical protein
MFATFRFLTSHRSSMNIIIPDPFARAWNYYKEGGLISLQALRSQATLTPAYYLV